VAIKNYVKHTPVLLGQKFVHKCKERHRLSNKNSPDAGSSDMKHRTVDV
jgi:hypothetical protein